MDEKETKIKKIVWIIISIIIALLIIIITYSIIKNQKTEKYLKSNGYKSTVDKIYKKEKETDTSTIIYTYNLNEKSFTKTEEIIKESTKEMITITNKNNIIRINYTYKDLDGCFLIQEGITEKEKYECNVIKRNKNSCKLRCEQMLKYINEFKKESKKIN